MWRVFGWVAWLAMVGLLCGALLANSLYLDRNGITVPGVVTAKDEHIKRVRHTLDWQRSVELTVRYTPHDEPWEHAASIPIDIATYDLLRPGSTVAVRYHPQPWGRFLPFGVRLEHQTTSNLLSLINWRALLPLPFLLLFAAAASGLRYARSQPSRLALGSLTAIFGVALVVSVAKPDVFTEQRGPYTSATATVRKVERITQHPGRRRRSSNELLQPIDRVQLALDARGDGTMVVAVDDIDAGSLPELHVGLVLPVTYPAADPRAARINGAARSHRIINWLALPLNLALLGVIFAAGWLLLLLWRLVIRRRVASRALHMRRP